MKRKRKVLTPEEAVIEKLSQHYHTVPLVDEELEKLCEKAGVNFSLARMALTNAVKTKKLNFTTAFNRTIVYLDRKN